jgi:hypothetical protein
MALEFQQEESLFGNISQAEWLLSKWGAHRTLLENILHTFKNFIALSISKIEQEKNLIYWNFWSKPGLKQILICIIFFTAVVWNMFSKKCTN